MDDRADHECAETLREVEAFLDGEADTVLRQRIERHLSDCSPCTGRAEFRTHLKQLVRDKCGDEPVPDDVVSRIRSLLSEADATG